MKEQIKEFGAKVKETVKDNKSKIIKAGAIAGGMIVAGATAMFVRSRCDGCQFEDDYDEEFYEVYETEDEDYESDSDEEESKEEE